MAERMAEYVGWKDPIGDGLYNMGVTDERIVRCRDCKHSRKDGTRCVFLAAWQFVSADEYTMQLAEVEPEGFCKWGAPREEQA